MTTLIPWADTVQQATDYLTQADPVMAEAIRRAGPCTLTANPDVFEALIDAIISQQISIKAADAILARVRAATPDNTITPEALATLDHEQLRALGLSRPKASYVRNLTELVVSGELDLVALEHRSDEEIIEHLTKVKGIGRWTAEMILIFSFARTDVLPLDDLGFVEGVRSAYALEARPTRQELLALSENWRPYRTFATWYMWAWRRIEQKNDRERTRIISL